MVRGAYGGKAGHLLVSRLEVYQVSQSIPGENTDAFLQCEWLWMLESA